MQPLLEKRSGGKSLTLKHGLAGWTRRSSGFFSYVSLYTPIFLLLTLLVYSPFFLEGKTLIITGDSIWQHYPAFVYEGRYVREVLHSLFSGGGFILPMWDFSIGLGADIATSLHYYGFGDPLTWLFALLPESLSPASFSVLFLLKTYLAGLACLWFVYSHRFGKWEAMVSALLYPCSMFVFLFVLRELSFGNVLFFLPLMLSGADGILEERKPWLFAGAVFGMGICNFYFLYQSVILTVGYVLFRMLTEKRFAKGNGAGFVILRFFYYGSAGVFLSAPVLLPVLSQIASSPRLSFRPYVPLLYPWKYYLSFLPAFTGVISPSETLVMGYTGAAFLALLRLFTLPKGEERRWKAAFLLLLCALLLPAAGALMNGCSYPSNRWAYAFSLFISVLTGKMLPRFSLLTKKTKWIFVAGSFIFVLLPLCLAELRRPAAVVPSALLLLFLCVLLPEKINAVSKRTRTAFVLFVLTGIFVNALFEFAPFGEDSARERGLTAKAALTRNLAEEADEALSGDPSFYRLSESALSLDPNSHLVRGGNGITMYLSITSPFVPDYMDALYISNSRTFSWKGFDSRFVPEALSRVKYTFAGKEEERFGYGKSGRSLHAPDGEELALLEASHPLPFGIFYANAVSEADFFALPAEERAERLLTDAVLPDPGAVGPSLKPSGSRTAAKNITEETDSFEYVEYRDGKYIVTVPDASFRMKLSDEGPGEYYAVFSDMHYAPLPARESREWRNASRPEKVLLLLKYFFQNREEAIRIQTECAGKGNQFSYLPEWNEYFCNRRNFMLPLGRFEEAPKELTIIFPYPGIYTFDGLYAAAQPYRGLEEKVTKLGEHGMEETRIGINGISGSIEAAEDGVLMLGAPYSPGWHATVDGKETPVFKGNLMELAIPLTKGKHEVRLAYETPFLRAGLALFAFGLLLAAAALFSKRGK